MDVVMHSPYQSWFNSVPGDFSFKYGAVKGDYYLVSGVLSMDMGRLCLPTTSRYILTTIP